MQVFKGDYVAGVLDREPLDDVVTAIEFVGDFGECRAKTLPASAFRDTPLDWHPFTLRGYGQAAALPRMTHVDMSDATPCWNLRIVENGQMVLFKTREERDANLSDGY